MIRRNATTVVEATTVVGDSLLVDAYVSYTDTFTRAYSEMILEDACKSFLEEGNVRVVGYISFY